MKKIYLILFILFINFINNYSQPIISYITPDIGAPGMAIYVEFIGPHDKKDNFGIDGPYLSKSQQTEIVFADPTDKDKVKVGPMIVSWEGRMISAILYISENLNPNSFDALSASPIFQIELKVRVGNDTSNSQTFYIVKSRPYIDLTNSTFADDSIFGSFDLGRRSPRGAMIYDSLKLAPRKYWVSTDDTDPNISGNQGLLPFTLLAKGRISGAAGISKITSNGGDVLFEGKSNGMVQDASPGGGGGGGSFIDVTGDGFRGGNGFTGGGPGGRNASGIPFATNYYTKPPSTGSGPYLAADDKHGGYSLNGVPGPVFGAYEAAGGGTGHPFGRSGEACGDGDNCEPVGGAGGGSGWKQNSPGGSGGYATEGSSSSADNLNGGKAHGNIMVVPNAGGSGGAGGNPECIPIPGRSGAGGAGGGAIRIFALEIDGVDFEAIGADGATNDCDKSEGGSGSGGHVGVQAKLMINKSRINVDGGKNNRTTGGAGRVRADYPKGLDINLSTANASLFKGPTTDTTHIIRSNHVLTGSQASGMISNLYVSKDNGDWRLISVLTDENWAYDLSTYLNKQSGTYYVAVATIIDNPAITDHSSEPHEVLSQAATNILRLDLRPFINGDENVSANKIYCIGETITLSARIWNESQAEANLEVFLSDNNWLLGDNGFKILGPVKNETYGIKPGDTAEILVTYTMPTGADPSQPASNILLIPSNDPDYPNGKDWKIQFNVDPAFTPEISFVGNISSPISLDTTKVGLVRDTSFVLVNSGNSDLFLSHINNIVAPFELVSTEPSLPVLLKMGEEIKVNVRFKPSTTGSYSSIITLNAPKTDTTCALEQHTEIKAVSIVTDVDIPSVIDLGLVPYCENPIFNIKMKNLSPAKLTITMFPKLIGPDADLFQVIKKQEEIIVLPPFDPSEPEIGVIYEVQLLAIKNRIGPFSAKFYFTTDDPKFDTIFVDIVGEIVGFEVSASPLTVNLGNVPVGFNISSSFILSNSGKLNNHISSIVSKNNFAEISGLIDSTLFAFTGTRTVNFKLTPKVGGAINDSIIVYFDEPCSDSIVVYLQGVALLANPTVYADEFPIIIDTTQKLREIDCGDYPECITQGLRIFISFDNSSEAPYIVLGEEITEDVGGRFKMISSSLTYPDTINAQNGDPVFGAVIEFDPAGAPVGPYTGKFKITLMVNGNVIEYFINLKATVYRGRFNVVTNPVVMNGIVNTTTNFNVRIENVGPEILKLNSHIPPSLSSIFAISPNPDNIEIKTGQVQNFQISFTPVDIVNYRDSITIFSTNSFCDSTFVIYLNGKGEPSKELLVYIPDLNATPDQKNYQIPVLGKFKKVTDSLSNMNISFKLKFNRSLFLPKEITNGEIVSNTIDGRNRILDLIFADFNVSPTDSIIGFIDGTTLLGDSKSTDFEISELDIVERNLVSSIESENGSLTIEICEEGGDRLLDHQLNPFSINVSPNPVNEVLNININTLEKGYHVFILSDLNGTEIFKESWLADNSGSNKYLKFNSNKLSSGIYFIKVISPNDVQFSKINVIK